ncbi:hypothetical protein AMJ51_00375 [Microgenomates bacterium DG_75]|nr:MAG: hypothetical protein AMJ51_00375 [Microgenomates bacterium DG_75]
MNKKQTLYQGKKRKTPSLKFSQRSPLSRAANDLLSTYEKQYEKASISSTQPRIRVGQVLGSVAFTYEKIRNVFDYKGEHLLRRNAIQRILRRLIWERGNTDPPALANSLTRELIWARYFENETIPQNKVDEIAKIIAKYLELLNLVTKKEKRNKKNNDWRDWVLGIASCEIEECLVPELFTIEAYSQAMFFWFKENFDWQDEDVRPREKDIQIYIAIHRSLPKSDEARIHYHLLKVYFPNWEIADEVTIEKVKKNIFEIRQEIDGQLNHPLQLRLYRFVQRHAAPFQILQEVIEENPRESRKILANPEKLEKKVREICERRYSQIREKVNRGIIRSIIYIFVTKVLLAFILEIPFEIFVLKKINLLPIAINAFIPPALMFFVGLSIRRPDEANTERVIERIKSFVYLKEGEEKISFSLVQTKRKGLISNFFPAVYGALFILTFGGITYLLVRLNFNPVSALIFFVFLSLVLLFGFRVRFTASEVMVTGEKESFFPHLFTNITLPLLNLGSWLSRGLAQLNILMVLMDFFIEAPLKSIIEVVEEWTSFIRERKEEVVEVPGP